MKNDYSKGEWIWGVMCQGSGNTTGANVRSFPKWQIYYSVFFDFFLKDTDLTDALWKRDRDILVSLMLILVNISWLVAIEDLKIN